MTSRGNSSRKPILTAEEREEFEGYEFPLENLALQGGGSKGLAYVGTLRVNLQCQLPQNAIYLLYTPHLDGKHKSVSCNSLNPGQ